LEKEQRKRELEKMEAQKLDVFDNAEAVK